MIYFLFRFFLAYINYTKIALKKLTVFHFKNPIKILTLIIYLLDN